MRLGICDSYVGSYTNTVYAAGRPESFITILSNYFYPFSFTWIIASSQMKMYYDYKYNPITTDKTGHF